MILLDLRVHRAGVDHLFIRLPDGIPFQSHAALRARTGFIGSHLRVHGAEILRAGGRFYRGVFVTMMRMVAVFVVLVVRMTPVFGFCRKRRHRLSLSEKLLPTMFAAKVKLFPTAFSAKSRRFVYCHSANWVFCHRKILRERV